MLYRHPDGSYTASSPDGEWSRHMPKEEGDAIIRSYRERARQRGEMDGVETLDTILSEKAPGFVVT